MNGDEAAAIASGLPGVTCDQPFGPNADVYKIGGRIFAILAASNVPATINLKCDPSRALELRTLYSSITGGYHQDKRHWNTVILDGSVPDDEVAEMIRQSYALVVDGLSRNARSQLGAPD
jgi:predicted DNA-binding protein (MmcQ/YjbR family)